MARLRIALSAKRVRGRCSFGQKAAGLGFEPKRRLHAQRFSRPLRHALSAQRHRRRSCRSEPGKEGAGVQGKPCDLQGLPTFAFEMRSGSVHHGCMTILERRIINASSRRIERPGSAGADSEEQELRELRRREVVVADEDQRAPPVGEVGPERHPLDVVERDAERRRGRAAASSRPARTPPSSVARLSKPLTSSAAGQRDAIELDRVARAGCADRERALHREQELVVRAAAARRAR